MPIYSSATSTPTCQYQRSDDTWWVANRTSLNGGRYAGFSSFQDFAFQHQGGFGGGYDPWAWTGMGTGSIYGPSFEMLGAGSNYAFGSPSTAEMNADAQAVKDGSMNIADYAAKYGVAPDANIAAAMENSGLFSRNEFGELGYHQTYGLEGQAGIGLRFVRVDRSPSMVDLRPSKNNPESIILAGLVGWAGFLQKGQPDFSVRHPDNDINRFFNVADVIHKNLPDDLDDLSNHGGDSRNVFVKRYSTFKVAVPGKSLFQSGSNPEIFRIMGVSGVLNLRQGFLQIFFSGKPSSISPSNTVLSLTIYGSKEQLMGYGENIFNKTEWNLISGRN